MTELIFASTNKGKVNEVKNLLSPLNIQTISLKELGFNEQIAETETTFVRNANLKSNTIFKRFNIPCFSDDSGLEVLALNNKPGVYSARYAGENATDYDNRVKLLSKLSNVINRTAYFKTVISLQLSDKEIKNFEGSCEGIITNKMVGENGFGYDSIFKPNGSELTFAQMTTSQKNEFSHRKKAMKKMIDYLTEFAKK